MNLNDQRPQVKSRWAFHGPSNVTNTSEAITTVSTSVSENRNNLNSSSGKASPSQFSQDERNVTESVTDKPSEPMDAGDHYSKYRNVNTHQTNSNRYYHGVHPKHLKPSRWSGFWTFLNSFALVIVLLVQGSILNYYVIYFRGGKSEWYFLFFFDFLILILFMFSITFAWRFHQRNRKTIAVTDTNNSKGFLDVQTAIPIDHERYGSGIFRFSFPKAMGMLPLIYICWIVYSVNLVIKMIVMYSLNIPDQMVRENFQAPKEVILISLAGAVAVFLFWVEANWNLGDERQRHLSKPSVDDLISHTAFEFFDSLTFLDLVTPDDMKELENDDKNISYAMKMVVLSFACVNFLLPTLGLYRLSRTHYGEKTYGMLCIVSETTGKPSTRGLGISILYHLLRLVAVNIPYLVVRIFLSSNDSRKEMSIFIIKNVLGILISVRNLVPEIKMWLLISKFKAKVRADMASENHNGRLRIKIDPSGKFDPISQAWELPTILESKAIDSTSRNPKIAHSHADQFHTSMLSNESSVDDIEEMDTATTVSTPSPASKQNRPVKT